MVIRQWLGILYSGKNRLEWSGVPRVLRGSGLRPGLLWLQVNTSIDIRDGYASLISMIPLIP